MYIIYVPPELLAELFTKTIAPPTQSSEYSERTAPTRARRVGIKGQRASLTNEKEARKNTQHEDLDL